MKTGKPRDSDWWQAALYVVLLPKQEPELLKTDLSGAVRYSDGTERIVSLVDAQNGWPNAAAWIKAVGGAQGLPATPSVAECRWCDIASCPHRAPDVEEAIGQTDDF